MKKRDMLFMLAGAVLGTVVTYLWVYRFVYFPVFQHTYGF